MMCAAPYSSRCYEHLLRHDGDLQNADDLLTRFRRGTHRGHLGSRRQRGDSDGRLSSSKRRDGPGGLADHADHAVGVVGG